MDRLLQIDLAKGITLKFYFYKDLKGQMLGDVAGIQAHELGHVIARHTSEHNSKTLLAKAVATILNIRGELGEDLTPLRLQEAKADRMGLAIMSQTGFDPQCRIDHLKRAVSHEAMNLQGREEMPEFLSTHPSLKTRLMNAEAGLTEAKDIFEKGPPIEQDPDVWKVCQEFVGGKYLAHRNQPPTHPKMLLARLEGRMERVEGFFVQMIQSVRGEAAGGAPKSDNVHGQRDGDEVNEVVSGDVNPPCDGDESRANFFASNDYGKED
ncbi:hypothetical protein BKA61DRAFT_652660 [Leptodontidium sp. MPI-SDFR-AT-0119]|nr:hypothetical protein BKA61DRAFT_652660 [Leptodontidium sp. MPI-SDFR-AT-0119]